MCWKGYDGQWQIIVFASSIRSWKTAINWQIKNFFISFVFTLWLLSMQSKGVIWHTVDSLWLKMQQDLRYICGQTFGFHSHLGLTLKWRYIMIMQSCFEVNAAVLFWIHKTCNEFLPTKLEWTQCETLPVSLLFRSSLMTIIAAMLFQSCAVDLGN